MGFEASPLSRGQDSKVSQKCGTSGSCKQTGGNAVTINEVDPILLNAGFTKDESSSFGDHYSRPLRPGFSATAYASRAGKFFLRKSQTLSKKSISLWNPGAQLFDAFPLQHCRNTLARLWRNDRVSETPDLLKCPQCNKRYVQTKEPRPGGKKFKPFLSCEGMRIVGKGNRKHPECDGTSDALPALVIYR